jgi:hypothetical protein
LELRAPASCPMPSGRDLLLICKQHNVRWFPDQSSPNSTPRPFVSSSTREGFGYFRFAVTCGRSLLQLQRSSASAPASAPALAIEFAPAPALYIALQKVARVRHNCPPKTWLAWFLRWVPFMGTGRSVYSSAPSGAELFRSGGVAGPPRTSLLQSPN